MLLPRHLAGVGLGVAIAIAAFPGCLPDFTVFEIVGDGPGDGGPEDGGEPPDDGGPSPNNPIDFGQRCRNPHLAVALVSSSSSGPGQLRHYNIAGDGTLSECHERDLARQQGAFGHGVNAVTGMPDGSQVIAVDYAIMRLDGEGFPRWRWQLWDNDALDYSRAEVFPLRIGDAWYIGALHCASSCSYGFEGPLVLDLEGNAVTHIDDISGVFGLGGAAPHPDGSARAVVVEDYGPALAYRLTTETTELSADEADPVGGGFDIDGYGSFESLEVDLESQRMAATLRDGVALWTVGQPIPSAPMACDGCSGYVSAAIDPNDAHGAYVICSLEGHQSLVRVTLGACEVVVDGSTLGDHRIVDVALIRGELP